MSLLDLIENGVGAHTGAQSAFVCARLYQCYSERAILCAHSAHFELVAQPPKRWR